MGTEPSIGKDCLFIQAFRVAVRPKLPPIQFAPGAPSQIQRYHGVKLTVPLHLTSALK